MARPAAAPHGPNHCGDLPHSPYSNTPPTPSPPAEKATAAKIRPGRPAPAMRRGAAAGAKGMLTIAAMAATDKCLAQTNKSGGAAAATKGRLTRTRLEVLQ